jgi:hypothetical protein
MHSTARRSRVALGHSDDFIMLLKDTLSKRHFLPEKPDARL